MVNMKLETKRNLLHLLVGVAFVTLFHFNVIDVWILLGIVLAGSVISILSRKRRVLLIRWFLDRFEREEDMASIPGRGSLFFFIGFLVAASVFQKDVALASMIIVVVGDSVSPLVGARAGRIRHPLSNKKFIEGNIAGFIAAFLAAMLFVSPLEAFVASLFAMTAEAVDSVRGRRIEDNITIPLISGLAITVIRTIF